MKKCLIVILVCLTMICYAKEEVKPDSLRTISLERGYIPIQYEISRHDESIVYKDFPDSTLIYFYKNYTQKGIIYQDQRSGDWSFPEMEERIYKVIWRRAKNDSIGGKK